MSFVAGIALSTALCAALIAADSTRQYSNTPDIITLREYVDVRFEAQQKAVEAALASADRAVVKAEAASDKRFDSVNEFRKTLSDETATFLTRLEYEHEHKALYDKVQELTARVSASESRSLGLAQGWAYLVGIIGVGVALVSGFLQYARRNSTGRSK
jgi:hypothetical protein